MRQLLGRENLNESADKSFIEVMDNLSDKLKSEQLLNAQLEIKVSNLQNRIN